MSKKKCSKSETFSSQNEKKQRFHFLNNSVIMAALHLIPQELASAKNVCTGLSKTSLLDILNNLKQSAVNYHDIQELNQDSFVDKVLSVLDTGADAAIRDFTKEAYALLLYQIFCTGQRVTEDPCHTTETGGSGMHAQDPTLIHEATLYQLAKGTYPHLDSTLTQRILALSEPSTPGEDSPSSSELPSLPPNLRKPQENSGSDAQENSGSGGKNDLNNVSNDNWYHDLNVSLNRTIIRRGNSFRFGFFLNPFKGQFGPQFNVDVGVNAVVPPHNRSCQFYTVGVPINVNGKKVELNIIGYHDGLSPFKKADLVDVSFLWGRDSSTYRPTIGTVFTSFGKLNPKDIYIKASAPEHQFVFFGKGEGPMLLKHFPISIGPKFALAGYCNLDKFTKKVLGKYDPQEGQLTQISNKSTAIFQNPGAELEASSKSLVETLKDCIRQLGKESFDPLFQECQKLTKQYDDLKEKYGLSNEMLVKLGLALKTVQVNQAEHFIKIGEGAEGITEKVEGVKQSVEMGTAQQEECCANIENLLKNPGSSLKPLQPQKLSGPCLRDIEKISNLDKILFLLAGGPLAAAVALLAKEGVQVILRVQYTHFNLDLERLEKLHNKPVHPIAKLGNLGSTYALIFHGGYRRTWFVVILEGFFSWFFGSTFPFFKPFPLIGKVEPWLEKYIFPENPNLEFYKKAQKVYTVVSRSLLVIFKITFLAYVLGFNYKAFVTKFLPSLLNMRSGELTIIVQNYVFTAKSRIIKLVVISLAHKAYRHRVYQISTNQPIKGMPPILIAQFKQRIIQECAKIAIKAREGLQVVDQENLNKSDNQTDQVKEKKKES